jgi:H+/Cl- antiporter ClcA
LPGETGPGPLSGFHFDLPLVIVPSVLAAALGTLIFGMVLGPEAPLIVLGSALGAILARNADPQTRKAMMLLGGVAAIGAVFGNPFVTAFMVLEFAAIGMVPAMLITPVLVALASSYVVQIGIWGLPGFGVHSLSVPDLPSYTNIAFGDLLTALVVSVLAGSVAILARKSGLAFERYAKKRVTRALFIGAIVTAGVVAIAMTIFDVSPELILFSGSAGMSELIKQTSVVSIVVILVGKAIAYAMALGGGFRGGPIFPATFLGVAIAVLTVAIIPGDSVSAIAAAAIAASAAAMIKLPATSALLGMVLIVGAGPAIAPFAILGAVIGFGIRTFVDSKDESVPEKENESADLVG